MISQIHQRVFAQEFDIRAALKTVWSDSTFSIAGLALRNTNARNLLTRTYGESVPVGAFHDGLIALDSGWEASAACAYEQFKTRLWIINTLRRHFAGVEDLHFTTLVDLRHRCVGSQLAFHTAGMSFYRLIQAYRSLLKSSTDVKMLAVAEISATRIGGAITFEPHVHVVTAGATKEQLVSVLPRSVPPFSRRIDVGYDIVGCGPYISKFAPEMYSHYIRDGQRRRRRNKMRPSEHAEWLKWHSRVQVHDLILTRGISHDLRRKSVSELLDALVGPYRRFPARRHGGP